MVAPRYSNTWPVPPDTPTLPMMARIRSLAVTPGGSAPSTLMAKVFGLRCSRHWVASTWPTSVLPMPKARAPNAPWVLVWLSPQTMVMPGWRGAELRADDVHDAAPRIAHAEQLDAELGGIAARAARTCRGGGIHRDRHAAEHLFGAGRASSDPWWRACDPGGAPAGPSDCSTLNACGEVTSWIRCRSM